MESWAVKDRHGVRELKFILYKRVSCNASCKNLECALQTRPEPEKAQAPVSDDAKRDVQQRGSHQNALTCLTFHEVSKDCVAECTCLRIAPRRYKIKIH